MHYWSRTSSFDFFIHRNKKVWYVSFNTNLGTFSKHGHGRAGVDSVNVKGLRHLDYKGHKISVNFTSKVTKHGEKASRGKMGGGIGEMEGWVENRCSLGSSLRAAIFLALSGWLEGWGRSSHTEYPITTPHDPRLSCKPPPHRLFHGQIYLIRSESYLTEHSPITDSGSVE